MLRAIEENATTAKEGRSMRSFSRCLAWSLLCFAPLGVPGHSFAASACPDNAHVDRVEIQDNVRTTYCKCDSGYEKTAKGCAVISTQRSTPVEPRTGQSNLAGSPNPKTTEPANTAQQDGPERKDNPTPSRYYRPYDVPSPVSPQKSTSTATNDAAVTPPTRSDIPVGPTSTGPNPNPLNYLGLPPSPPGSAPVVAYPRPAH
jgi:hypothetical protein